MVLLADDMEYYGGSYHECVGKVWGPFGEKLVSWFIVILQLAISIACILFTVDFIENEFCNDFGYCNKKTYY